MKKTQSVEEAESAPSQCAENKNLCAKNPQQPLTCCLHSCLETVNSQQSYPVNVFESIQRVQKDKIKKVYNLYCALINLY